MSRIKTNTQLSKALSNKDGNPKRLPESFYYDQYTFEDYKYNKSNFSLSIEIPFNKQISNYAKLITCKTHELVVELIKLRESLNEGLFNREDYKLRLDINGDKIVDETTINKITKWCKKWGYPFHIDITAFENPPSKFLSTKLKQPAHQSFSIADFLFSLNELYCLYRIYLVLVELDSDISDTLYMSNGNSFIDISDPKIWDYQRLFESKFNLLVLDSCIMFIDSSPYLQMKARSIFDAAQYQLAKMTYNYELEIRRCKMCQKTFIPKNGRQKYCHRKGCYPQRYYKHKISAEKRAKKNSEQKEKASN